MTRLVSWVAILLGLVAGESVAAESAATPEEEGQRLVDAGMVSVREKLEDEEVAEIYPFAFVLRADGRIQRLSPSAGVSQPDAVTLLGALQRRIKQKATDGEIRASAIFADVVVALRGAETDAILVGVEHEAGFCRTFYFTYLRTGDGELHVSTPIPTAREGVVFGTCE